MVVVSKKFEGKNNIYSFFIGLVNTLVNREKSVESSMRTRLKILFSLQAVLRQNYRSTHFPKVP